MTSTYQTCAQATLLGLAIVAASSQAEEAATENTEGQTPAAEAAESAPKPAVWAGNAELGFIETSGNSDTQSVNGKFGLSREKDALKTSLKTEALTSKENGTTSKEKYVADFKVDYSLDEFDYLTSNINYEDDRFSGYEYQYTFSLGYGYRAWNDEDGKLDLEIGPGYRRNVLDQRDDRGKKVEDEAVGRAALNLEVNISDNAKFTEVITIEGGESNVIYKSDMGLQSTLVGALAMKINYQVKYTEEVPEDTENTESQVGVTLVYSF